MTQGQRFGGKEAGGGGGRGLDRGSEGGGGRGSEVREVLSKPVLGVAWVEDVAVGF